MNTEIKTALEEYLNGLIKLMGDSAQIEFISESDREVMINLKGLSVIDGTDPKPLRSLSYLTEISMRRLTGKAVKVHLDANSMQEQRLRDLQQLAHSTAQKVLEEGQPIPLPPMETQDRKLIHEFLSEVEGVRTQSEGQGDDRKIVIDLIHSKKRRKDNRRRESEKPPTPKEAPSSDSTQPDQQPLERAGTDADSESISEAPTQSENPNLEEDKSSE